MTDDQNQEVPHSSSWLLVYMHDLSRWVNIVLCGMQGGLWRLTGQQIAGAAAEGEGAPATSKGTGGGGDGGADDVRGPHASLAVKLQVCRFSFCIVVFL